MFGSCQNSDKNGYCYIFDDPQNPHHGKLVEIKITDIEDFIGGISSKSVCCFLFPNLDLNKNQIKKYFDLNNKLANDDVFGAIYINNDSTKIDENLRFLISNKTKPFNLVQYLSIIHKYIFKNIVRD